MAVSYRIKSKYHLDSNRYSPTSLEIKPEEIKSNQIGKPGDARPNVTSWPYGEWRPIIEIGPFGEAYAVTRTSNNTFRELITDFIKPAHFYFSQRDDFQIDGMKRAGEDNPPYKHDLIPKMPDFTLIESPPLGMYFPNPRDTAVKLRTSHDIVNAVNPNRLGYHHSKLANFYQDLRKLMFDKANRLNYEAVEWINFLEEKGFSIDTTPNPGVIGLGIQHSERNYLAGYYPQGYLVAYDRFHKLAKDLISRYGLSEPEAVEAMKRSVLMHEIAHVLGIGGDDDSERLQGLLQAEFYTMMSKNFKGTKLERIYRALAREGEDYARDFSKSILDIITADLYPTEFGPIERIIAKFEAEARALGKKEQELRDYVEERIIDTYGPLLGGEPSYKEARRISQSKSSKSRNKKPLERAENLEEIAQKENVTFPTYNGRRVYGENGTNDSRTKKVYERAVGKSKYKNMDDVKEHNPKDGKERKEPEKAEQGVPKDAEQPAEEAPEAETAEASASSE